MLPGGARRRTIPPVSQSQQDHVQSLLKHAASLAKHRSSGKPATHWNAGMPSQLAHLELRYMLSELEKKLGTMIEWPSEDVVRVHRPGPKPVTPAGPVLPPGNALEWRTYPNKPDSYSPYFADHPSSQVVADSLESWRTKTYDPYVQTVKAWNAAKDTYTDLLSVANSLCNGQDRERVEIVLGCLVLTHSTNGSGGGTSVAESYPLLQWRVAPSIGRSDDYIDLAVDEEDLRSDIIYFPTASKAPNFTTMYEELVETANQGFAKEYTHLVDSGVEQEDDANDLERHVLQLANEMVSALNNKRESDQDYSIAPEFVLFTRRRQNPYIRFLEEASAIAATGSWTNGLYPAIDAATTDPDSAGHVKLGDPNYTTDDYLYTRPLTPDQLACVQKALATSFSAVTGPPGTGKTYVIAATVEAALARGERVLVTSENVTALSVVRNQLSKAIQPLSIFVTEAGNKASRDAQNTAVRDALTHWEKTTPESWLKRVAKHTTAFNDAAKHYHECLLKVHTLLVAENEPLGSGVPTSRLERILADMRSDAALPGVIATSVDLIDDFPLTDSEDQYLRDLAECGFNFEDRDLVANLLLALSMGYSLVEPATLRAHYKTKEELKNKVRDINRQIKGFVPPAFADATVGEEPTLILPEYSQYAPPPLEVAVLEERPAVSVVVSLAATPISTEHQNILGRLDTLATQLLSLKQVSPETRDLRLPRPAQARLLRESLLEVIESLTSSVSTPSAWREALRNLGALRNETLEEKQRLYDRVTSTLPVQTRPDRRALKDFFKQLEQLLYTTRLTKQEAQTLLKDLGKLSLSEVRTRFIILYADALSAAVLDGWPLCDSVTSLREGLSFFDALAHRVNEAEELGIRDAATMSLKELSAAVAYTNTEREELAEQGRRQSWQIRAQEVQEEYRQKCEAVDAHNKEISARADQVNESRQRESRDAHDNEYKQSKEAAEHQYSRAHAAWTMRNADFVKRREEHDEAERKRFSDPLREDIASLETAIAEHQQQLNAGGLLYETLPDDHALRGLVYLSPAGAREEERVATLRKQLESLKTLQVRHDPGALWKKLGDCSPSFAQALAKRWRDGEKIESERAVRDLWVSSHSSGLIRSQATTAITDNDWKELKGAAERLDTARSELCVARSAEAAMRRLRGTSFKKELLSLITALGKMTNTSTSKKSQRIEPERKRSAIAVSKQVPVLIATTRQALELFGGELLCGSGPQFDMVIVDEASQSPLESIVLLLLGKRVLVVGDKEQNSPQAVGVDEATMQALQRSLPTGIYPKREMLDMGFSLFDWAEHADKTDAVVLREHNRCSPEIIALSNKLVYAKKGQELLPLKPKAKNVRSLKDVKVEQCDINDDGVNLSEVVKVAEIVSESIGGRSSETVGVVLLCGEKDRKAYHKELVACLLDCKVDTAGVKIDVSAGFQGDERDIIVLALCVSNRNADGTPRKPGGWNTPAARQTLNVALSRAKKQLILVRSVDVDDLANNDVRKELLTIYSTASAGNATPTLEHHISRCHPNSPFEKDVVGRLFEFGYAFEVNEEVREGSIGWRRYRVDLAFINDDGQRIGLELDGERYHPVDQFEADWHRQKRLESAGWTIIRLSGRRYYSNPDEAIAHLRARLSTLKVEPNLAITSLLPVEAY